MNLEKKTKGNSEEDTPVMIFFRVSPSIAASLDKEAAQLGLTRPNLVKTIIYKHVNGIAE